MAEDIVLLDGQEPKDSIEELNPLGQIEEEQEQEPKKEPLKPENKKKKIISILLLLALVIIIIAALSILLNLKDETTISFADLNATKLVEKLQEKTKEQSRSKLDLMLKKANTLYEEGQKERALEIYESIANYSEALSNYNLGVAQMKEENYKEAKESFKKAIKNQENTAVSAINAAICSLELNQSKSFEFYIDLASAYLPEVSGSSIYSYYNGLINYYKGYYLEALSSLSHKSSQNYEEKQDYLASKLLSSFDNPYLAIEYLEKYQNLKNALPLGLLYARIGEYESARIKLESAKKMSYEPKITNMALALVQMKLGNFETASNLINDLREKYPKEHDKIYPIKAILKPELFDVNIAQQNFKESFLINKRNSYKILLYFAPYKVFNAKQAMNYIRQGGMQIYIDELDEAQTQLKTSSTISKVNISISKGIKAAINHKISKANKIFSDLIKAYPNHSVLHYNLALSYAQMENFSLAYKHFVISFHLNPKNYQAGVFGVIVADLSNVEHSKFLKEVQESIKEDDTLDETNLYSSMLNLVDNNQFALTRWLEHEKKENALNLIFDAIIAKKIFNQEKYLENLAKLKNLMPKDILVNIINFYAKHSNKDIKEYARAIQHEFMQNELNLEAFYHGAAIIKEQYIKILQISGLLHHQREKLKKQIEQKSENIVELTQTLAYLDIFTNHFEESYVLYNKLIDDYKEQDSRTIFLAATASIGANHPENAIALLELSKLIDKNNNESRFALGLLYLEARNYEAAAIQFAQISNSNFHSDFFDFSIIK